MGCRRSNSCYFLFSFVLLFFLFRTAKLLWAIFSSFSIQFCFQIPLFLQIFLHVTTNTSSFVYWLLFLPCRCFFPIYSPLSEASVVRFDPLLTHSPPDVPADPLTSWWNVHLLSPAQTPRRWSPCSWRCVRAWGGPWSWPAGCSEPTLRGCCGSSGCCPTGCCTPAPSTLRETRRSTPSATWTEMLWGSTPVTSSTRRERGNVPSWSRVKSFCWLRVLI